MSNSNDELFLWQSLHDIVINDARDVGKEEIPFQGIFFVFGGHDVMFRSEGGQSTREETKRQFNCSFAKFDLFCFGRVEEGAIWWIRSSQTNGDTPQAYEEKTKRLKESILRKIAQREEECYMKTRRNQELIYRDCDGVASSGRGRSCVPDGPLSGHR